MPYKFQDIERRLRKLGFTIRRQGRGSHVIFSDGRTTFPVPRHAGREISLGVEHKIIKLLGMSSEEFRKLI